MTTDKEIADKKNEVTMLRLQIAEHKERRRLDEIEQLELNDVLPSRNELTGKLESVFAVNRQQEDTIDTYKDAVASQNKVLKDFQDEINEKDTIIDESKTMINRLYDTYDSMYSTMLHMNHGLEVDLKVCGQDVERIEAELSNSKSAIVMKNGVINEKNKTIDELNETISDLRMAASDMLDTINECARGEAEDSRVLMQVVEIVKKDDLCIAIINQLADLLVDYLNAPESPVVTLKTPSLGTRVVSKNEETHIIDEAKMKAVRMLVDSEDHWVVSTDEDAVEVMEQKATIDELIETTRKLKGRLSSMYAANSDQDTTIDELNALLADEKMTLATYRNNPLSDQVADRDNRIEQLIVLNEALRVDIELAQNLSRDHIAGQDRFIEGLKTELDARNRVIKDFKAIEQKETARLHTVIDGNGKIIDELNDMYCDVCGKLEQIEKVTKDAISYVHIDEITKIIQEE